jgi:hypothetical protein
MTQANLIALTIVPVLIIGSVLLILPKLKVRRKMNSMNDEIQNIK